MTHDSISRRGANWWVFILPIIPLVVAAARILRDNGLVVGVVPAIVGCLGATLIGEFIVFFRRDRPGLLLALCSFLTIQILGEVCVFGSQLRDLDGINRELFRVGMMGLMIGVFRLGESPSTTSPNDSVKKTIERS